MSINLTKKPTKIFMWINEHGMLLVSLFKPISTESSPSMILNEETVEMLMPDMGEDRLKAFYEKEMKLTRRAALEKQKLRIQAELDSMCDEEK